MTFPAGTRLGPYEILAPLGAGGMGEVYRGRDTRLGRDVAIKVLPATVASDADRLSRFERENRAIAALSHPNIRAILDVTRDGHTAYAVMELLEGETLRDRLASGALAPRDAIGHAVQIAHGLAAAHDSGIAHRDLKPENLFLTRGDRVKILDFGLAKLLDPGASDVTGVDGTAAGSVMGTVGYMAPEQLRGHDVDHRADIFAFGAVLHEMLSGRRAFAGDSAADTISATLSTEPPEADAHVSGVPPLLNLIVRRCLEKRPEARFQSAHDLAFALEASGGAERPRAIEPAAGGWRRAGRWAAAAVVLALAGVIAWRGVDRATPAPVYATLAAPSGAVLGDDDPLAPLPTRTPMVFTPDGQSLIILATHLGKRQLFLRSLDRPDARPIAGTEGARVPFVSPDGQWVGFWMGGALRKVRIEGGEAVTLCALPSRFGPNGASWGDGEIIVFGDPRSGRLMRVSGSGGVPAPVTAEVPSGSQRAHVTPFVLPGGAHVLYADASWRDAAEARLMVQPLDGGESRLVMPSATDGRVLPSGQLAFMRLGTLMTVPFDLARIETRGAPVAALSGVMQSGLLGIHGAENTGAGMFAVSSGGALAVVRGPVTGAPDALLEWVTHTGRTSSADPVAGAPVGGRLMPRISPDQSRALVAVHTPLREELWIADWRRNVWIPCAGCDSPLAYAEWSPDGRRVLLTRGDALVAHTLDVATGDRVVVHEPGRTLFPSAWLPDGRIVYTSSPDNSRFEIKVLGPGRSAGRVVVPLGIGVAPAVSPGGRWLAYDTNPSGAQSNVIVEAFPGGGSRTQISAGGGSNPSWSADGRTLYYVVKDGDLVAVAVTTGSVFTAATPRGLFDRVGSGPCTPARCYDVAHDSRFLMDGPSRNAQLPVTSMDLVLNWTTTLGTRALEVRR